MWRNAALRGHRGGRARLCSGLPPSTSKPATSERSTRHLYRRRRLAKRGVVFLAAASAGEQYGPELTVSDGTGEAIAVAADFESNIVVRCDEEDGNPVQEDLAMVQRYVASVRRRPRVLEIVRGYKVTTAARPVIPTWPCKSCPAWRASAPRRLRPHGVARYVLM